ncbi:MAG: NAD(P)/FAD-dependent oxidoreductase [Erysipelotrichaceae bacterium]|nr:NAD(P)/FAD-dependent oxidoreductase [Erysipelotrichaceae bacterium]MDD3810346.1 NAD(P)/FAD-dependent oxidoreductase [Erysipelotrichaceae bacterium]
MKTVIIIGGGAAGLFAASQLNFDNIRVVLIEQNAKLGKKLLATGNGRGNISNLAIDQSSFYNGDRFLDDIRSFDAPGEFEKLGMPVRFDNNLVYPYSNSAKTVLDAFMMNMDRVEIMLETQVVSVVKKDRYHVNTNRGEFFGDFVINATGSIAGGYNPILESLNDSLPVKVNPWRPVLVMLKTKPVYPQLKGVRVKAKVSLFVDNREVTWRIGEVLFNDTGLSGICIMELSRYCCEYANAKVEVVVDLLPNYSKDQAYRMHQDHLERFGDDYRKLIFTSKLADVLKNQGITDYKNFRFAITGTLDYKRAQVMRGGVDLDDINDDFSLKSWPHYYIIGEALDVDGDCGGYNLHFAFTSAKKASQAILEAVKNA